MLVGKEVAIRGGKGGRQVGGAADREQAKEAMGGGQWMAVEDKETKEPSSGAVAGSEKDCPQGARDVYHYPRGSRCGV